MASLGRLHTRSGSALVSTYMLSRIAAPASFRMQRKRVGGLRERPADTKEAGSAEATITDDMVTASPVMQGVALGKPGVTNSLCVERKPPRQHPSCMSTPSVSALSFLLAGSRRVRGTLCAWQGSRM